MKNRVIILLLAMLVLGTSCKDWLDADSNLNKKAEDFLKTEIGFKNALTGVYIKMNNANAYGNQFTMGFVEFLAQHWDPQQTDSYERYLTDFKYSYSTVESSAQSMFLQMYNIIAEANLILQNIDQQREIFNNPKTADLIKAEALGIRAWCHFDILRLWGPVPGHQTGTAILPYVKEFSRDLTPYSTYAGYMEQLLSDITEAEELLAEIDPIMHNSLNESFNGSSGEGFVDSYWRYRQTRINYYAMCGLKARAYLWNGNREEALTYARKIIDAEYVEGRKVYSLAAPGDFQYDPTLHMEHIFTMEVNNLEELVRERFRNSGTGNYQKSRDQISTLYENTDNRFKFWWSNVLTSSSETSSVEIHTLIKYFQNTMMAPIQANKVPLMRLSEMYLIAIECGDTDAARFYTDFCASRGSTEGDLENQNTLLDEYNKEFYGEGQMFFMYKRKGSTVMTWGSGALQDIHKVYVLPIPLRETNR